MLKLNEIDQIQIELTTRCNARCPMCMRNYRGFEYNSGYPITELTLDNLKSFFNESFLQGLSKGISFNGNLGDFGLARDAQSIVHWLADLSVPVYINTNGSMRTAEWWASLARPGVRIGFALDGLEHTHDLYRLDTDWHRVIAHAQAYINAGGHAIWRFIPFDHNRHEESACRALAESMGFASFENIDEGRNCGPVFSRTGELQHHLGQPWESVPPIQSMVESHITWFDAGTVQHPADVNPLQLTCNHMRQRDIYVAADGRVYPCCYLGFYPDTMCHPGNSQLKQLVQENSLFDHDLEHCLNWFDLVEQSWALPSIAQGRLYQCVNSCSGVG